MALLGFVSRTTAVSYIVEESHDGSFKHTNDTNR